MPEYITEKCEGAVSFNTAHWQDDGFKSGDSKRFTAMVDGARLSVDAGGENGKDLYFRAGAVILQSDHAIRYIETDTYNDEQVKLLNQIRDLHTEILKIDMQRGVPASDTAIFPAHSK